MSWPPKWTPDCQGKWDYDGPIVHISTRYWPRGGSADIYLNGVLLEIKPSAHSAIYSGNVKLCEREFEGETEEEVKHAVEVWASDHYQRIVDILGEVYGSAVE